MTASNYSEEETYSSYNAASRTAMFMGVPLMVVVLMMVLALVCAFIAQALLGLIGLLVVFPFFPIFLFIRQLTQTDDKAMRILMLEGLFFMKYRVLKSQSYQVFGKTITFTPSSYTRHVETYQPFFENQGQRKA